VLNPQERGTLADTARKKQESVGWKIVTDPGTGVRLGIPDQTGAAAGQRRQRHQMDVADRHDPDSTGAAQGSRPRHGKARRAREEGAGRNIDYTVVKPDFFVLSGLQGLKKFYLRGTSRATRSHPHHPLRPGDREYRGAGRDRDVERVQRVSGRRAGGGPPPRKTVEYGTGVVVSDDGAIIADRQITDGCLTVAIAGFGNADRVAEDKEHDLALLRIYGARGLKALNLANAAAKTALDLTGIADPQNQGGGAAVTGVKASVAPAWRRAAISR
jgi:hypothetical protein